MTLHTIRSAVLVLTITMSGSAAAADLSPQTAAAFEAYVRATEARMDTELAGGPFLWPERLAAAERSARMEALRRGALLVERLQTGDRGRPLQIPGGLAHHWVGVAFISGATLDSTLRLLQDYDRHAAVYMPRVARSQLRSEDGGTFEFHLRFMMKKVITVVLDSENVARFTRPSRDRAWSRVVSTRIAEVEHAGSPEEREKPVGRDSGYLWRLNTYWRLLEQDGGTYVQCESLSLTRDIPTGFGWLVGPFVTSLPRESLEFTLDTTRRTLAAR